MPSLQRRSGTDEFFSIIFGISVQLARTYLFIKTAIKAVIYIVLVAILSFCGDPFQLTTNFYFAKKQNLLNEFGVKLGWFWTLLLLVPFIYITTKAHGKNTYVVLDRFVIFERRTGRCYGSEQSSRSNCRTDGGKWIPGFDISGHCFLLIYSSLIICEESHAFRNIPYVYEKGSTSRRTKQSLNEVFTIKIYFLLLFALHLIWDFELIVTTLCYHHIHHKLVGAAFGIACWYFTYHIWYPVIGVPPAPICIKVRQKHPLASE
uniref:FIT family protein n=1 Tax=Syphacia muris TaxID=451379 RepID=A0A0N5APM1_9BILA